MTINPEPTEAPIIPPRRHPVSQSKLVRSTLVHTFDTVVRSIGAWWPTQPFSAGQDRVHDVTVEGGLGGRCKVRRAKMPG
jgi:hypothetical protein